MGVQSAFASFLKVGGNLARLFTVLVEVDDILIKLNLVISFILNSAVFVQFFIYPGLEKKGAEVKISDSSNPQLSPRKKGKKKVKRD